MKKKRLLTDREGQYQLPFGMIGLSWTRTREHPITLECQALYENGAVTMTGLREETFVEIANWCSEHNCGKRMAWNQFQFKSEKQVTMFLLKWA